MDKVRTAFIGVGYRGKQLFRLLQNIPFFQVQAVADPGEVVGNIRYPLL